MGVTVPRDFCWNSRLGLSCPSAAVSMSLQPRSGAAVFSLCPSVHPPFLPYGVKLVYDHQEEMGSGFVCAPPAPQGPPKQVEGGGQIRKNEGNKVIGVLD